MYTVNNVELSTCAKYYIYTKKFLITLFWHLLFLILSIYYLLIRIKIYTCIKIPIVPGFEPSKTIDLDPHSVNLCNQSFLNFEGIHAPPPHTHVRFSKRCFFETKIVSFQENSSRKFLFLILTSNHFCFKKAAEDSPFIKHEIWHIFV